jgi:hypothetical protein
MMSYKDNYKSIQLNIPKDKHQELIDWLYDLCEQEERSVNSFLIKLLKEEKERHERNKDMQ